MGDRGGRAAGKVAADLLREVAATLETEGDAPWTGMVVQPDRTFVPRALPRDLYQGIAGLAVTFARGADLSDDEDLDRLADAAVGRLVAASEVAPAGPDVQEGLGLGALGGELWAAARLAHRARERGGTLGPVASWLRSCIERLATSVRRPGGAGDLMAGEAGALAALVTAIELDLVAGEPLHAPARRLVDRLLAAQIETPHGVVWPLPGSTASAVGLGHGSGGITLALARSAAVVGHRVGAVSEAVDAATAHEDATVDRPLRNWRDPWAAGPTPMHRSAWCYGAAGMHIVRHRLGRALPVGLAGATTIDSYPVDHLCCGTAGRVVAALEVGDPGAAAAADDLVRRAASGELRVTDASGDGAAGLFLGRLGVAWALLHAGTGQSGADLLTLS